MILSVEQNRRRTDRDRDTQMVPVKLKRKIIVKS